MALQAGCQRDIMQSVIDASELAEVSSYGEFNNSSAVSANLRCDSVLYFKGRKGPYTYATQNRPLLDTPSPWYVKRNLLMGLA